MKRTFRVFLAGSAAIFLSGLGPAHAGPAEEALRAGDRVALCGDSITEFGGYSAIIGTYLVACQPRPDLSYKAFGWSGETVTGFARRLESTVLPFSPSVATLLYGMNDGGYRPLTGQTTEKFGTSLLSAIEQLKAGGVRLIIVAGPTPVDPVLFDPTAEKNKFAADAGQYNETLGELARIARQIAEEAGARYVPLHQPLLDLLQKAKAKYGEAYDVVGPDGFHPQQNGGLLIAQEILKAMGCDGDIGTLTLDMATGQATATDGHKVLTSGKNSLEVESTRYPFCFVGERGARGRNGALLDFLPFNAELNRFRLMVKNSPAGSLKVTWGPASRTFSAAELQEGVNLAEAFPVNPFQKPFYKLFWDLRKKNEEAVFQAGKRLWSLKSKLESLSPDAPEFSALELESEALTKSLQDNARFAVPPVRHIIALEAAAP